MNLLRSSRKELRRKRTFDDETWILDRFTLIFPYCVQMVIAAHEKFVHCFNDRSASIAFSVEDKYKALMNSNVSTQPTQQKEWGLLVLSRGGITKLALSSFTHAVFNCLRLDKFKDKAQTKQTKRCVRNRPPENEVLFQPRPALYLCTNPPGMGNKIQLTQIPPWNLGGGTAGLVRTIQVGIRLRQSVIVKTTFAAQKFSVVICGEYQWEFQGRDQGWVLWRSWLQQQPSGNQGADCHWEWSALTTDLFVVRKLHPKPPKKGASGQHWLAKKKQIRDDLPFRLHRTILQQIGEWEKKTKPHNS